MTASRKFRGAEQAANPPGCDLSAGISGKPYAVPGRIAFFPSCFATLLKIEPAEIRLPLRATLSMRGCSQGFSL
jgi:hypothetical protein